MNSRLMKMLSSLLLIAILALDVEAETTQNSTFPKNEDFSVECDDEKMTIFILKDKITIPESDLSQYNISWNDPDCRPSQRSNETHLILVAGYSSCGTEADVESHNIIFKNTVSVKLNTSNTYKNNELEVIDIYATYAVECNVPRKVNLTQENGVNITMPDLVAGKSSSTDKFIVSMNLHTSSTFDKTLTYPAVVDMLGRFNLEVELDTVADLYIVPQNCYGTPDASRDNAVHEEIVTDRCPNSDHVFKEETSADNGKKFRFSLNVFRFKNTTGMVYIHCSAHVCLKDSQDEKCQFGCTKARRRRRSVNDNSLAELSKDLSKDYDIRTGLIIITEASDEDNSAQQDAKELKEFFQTTTNIILMALILVMIMFVLCILVTVCVRRRRNILVKKAKGKLSHMET